MPTIDFESSGDLDRVTLTSGPGTVALSTDDTFSGTQSLKLNAVYSSVVTFDFSGMVPVGPVTISMWVRMDGGAGTGSFYPMMSTGSYIEYINWYAPTGGNADDALRFVGAQWYRASFTTFCSDPLAFTVDVRMVAPDPGTGYIHIDDISVEAYSVPITLDPDVGNVIPGVRTTAHAHTGTHSIAMINSQNSQIISDLWPGYEMTISAWVYCEAGATAFIRSNYARHVLSTQSATTGAWEHLELHISLHWTRTFDVNPDLYATSTGGAKAYWDDITITCSGSYDGVPLADDLESYSVGADVNSSGVSDRWYTNSRASVDPTALVSDTHAHSGMHSLEITLPPNEGYTALWDFPSVIAYPNWTINFDAPSTNDVWVYVPSGQPAAVLALYNEDTEELVEAATSTVYDAWEKLTVHQPVNLYVTWNELWLYSSDLTTGSHFWVDDVFVAQPVPELPGIQVSLDLAGDVYGAGPVWDEGRIDQDVVPVATLGGTQEVVWTGSDVGAITIDTTPPFPGYTGVGVHHVAAAGSTTFPYVERTFVGLSPGYYDFTVYFTKSWAGYENFRFRANDESKPYDLGHTNVGDWVTATFRAYCYHSSIDLRIELPTSFSGAKGIEFFCIDPIERTLEPLPSQGAVDTLTYPFGISGWLETSGGTLGVASPDHWTLTSGSSYATRMHQDVGALLPVKTGVRYRLTVEAMFVGSGQAMLEHRPWIDSPSGSTNASAVVSVYGAYPSTGQWETLSLDLSQDWTPISTRIVWGIQGDGTGYFRNFRYEAVTDARPAAWTHDFERYPTDATIGNSFLPFVSQQSNGGSAYADAKTAYWSPPRVEWVPGAPTDYRVLMVNLREGGGNASMVIKTGGCWAYDELDVTCGMWVLVDNANPVRLEVWNVTGNSTHDVLAYGAWSTLQNAWDYVEMTAPWSAVKQAGQQDLFRLVHQNNETRTVYVNDVTITQPAFPQQFASLDMNLLAEGYLQGGVKPLEGALSVDVDPFCTVGAAHLSGAMSLDTQLSGGGRGRLRLPPRPAPAPPETAGNFPMPQSGGLTVRALAGKTVTMDTPVIVNGRPT